MPCRHQDACVQRRASVFLSSESQDCKWGPQGQRATQWRHSSRVAGAAVRGGREEILCAGKQRLREQHPHPTLPLLGFSSWFSYFLAESLCAQIPHLQTTEKACPVAQWRRIHLPLQETQVRSLVREDPTCRGATEPVRQNYAARALEPGSRSKRSHHNERPTHLNERAAFALCN